MPKFDNKEFAERLVYLRESKRLTQLELASKLNKDRSIISKYESGKTIPDIETIYDICNILKVEVGALLGLEGSELNVYEDTENLFGTDTLYIYYKIPYEKDKAKFRFDIIKKSNGKYVVNFVSPKNEKIYMTGRFRMNRDSAIFVFDNYIPNSPTLDITEIILNLKYSSKEYYRGFICGIGDFSQPTTRKCIISKKDLDFTDDMLEDLIISQKELKYIKENGYWNPDITNENDYGME